MQDAALFLHLIGVLLFVAGITLAGVAFESARLRERPAEIALLLGLARVAALIVIAGAIPLVAGGAWLAGLEDVGFDAGWFSAAVVLFVAALVLGGIGGQRPKRARQIASRLAEEGAGGESGELSALLEDPLSRAANYAAAVIVLAILALMVFKP